MTGALGQTRSGDRSWLAGLLLVGGLYLGGHLTRGWFPHDEGALGQTAERVLLGEVPHRDFDEPYTGLLTYVHAAAFQLGGVRLPVLRVPLFLASMCWLGAVFAIARRSAGPAASAGTALLALVWSVPNYPASMPSWYNLFCATFGLLALLRWSETGRAGWLMLAGATGGISVLFKVSGLFYVAGALLFLAFATHREAEGASGPRARPAVAVLLTIGLLGFVGLLWRMLDPYHVARAIIHFFVPGAALAIALGIREWTSGARNPARLRTLAEAGTPFVLGFLLPVGLFVAGFALAGALPELIQGVFVAPFRRLQFANMRPPAPFWILAAAPLAILVRPRSAPDDPRWTKSAGLAGVMLVMVLWLASMDSFPHRVVWQSIRSLIPPITVLAACLIAFPRLGAPWKADGVRRFVLLATVTGTASLIQFPFSSPTYFLYVAPLLLLTMAALVQAIGRTPRPLSAVTMVFYGAFAVALVVPGSTIGLAFRYEPEHPTIRLDLPRAGLRVNPDDAALYGALIPRLRARAGGGEIWAGPDAPEVYFLAGLRNRTRAVFDFLGGTGSTATVQLARPDVRAVVLNLRPSFSGPLAPTVADAIRARFPYGERIGRFELRWRD